jgi:signal transduction histidine kinase
MDSPTLHRLAAFLDALCDARELDARFLIDAGDEADQRVVQSLNAFLDKLWLKDFQLAAKQEMLEKVVEKRTREVHEILDNVSSGFLMALPDEGVLANYSRSCVRIFGREDLEKCKIGELLGWPERQHLHFSACYAQIFEDVLPPEVALGQLPSEFSRGEKSYRIQGAPIVDAAGLVTKVFFTITDTTELHEAEAQNALRLALLEIVRQREAFREFLFETAHAFAEARANPTQHTLRSVLHTIKGNLGCYGLHDLASLIHTIEDAVELSVRDVERVESTLRRFLATHHAFIGLAYPETTRAPRAVELERLRPFLVRLSSLDSGRERKQAIADFTAKLEWVPVGALLAPLAGVVERVSTRLDKLADLEIEGGEILVDPDWTSPVFSNLVHLVRNSLDHGIELPHERGPKPPRGRIKIRWTEDEASWRVELSDDGRGIDVEAVARAAVAKGRVTAERLAALSPDQRLELVFADGVSTKDSANFVSGRGVGAGALLDGIRAVGGQVHIRSTPGEGTTFELIIPRPTARRPSLAA